MKRAATAKPVEGAPPPPPPPDPVQIPRRDAARPAAQALEAQPAPANTHDDILRTLPTYEDVRREEVAKAQAEEDKKKRALDLADAGRLNADRRALLFDSKECMRCHPDPNKKQDFKLSLKGFDSPFSDLAFGPTIRDKIDSGFDTAAKGLPWGERASLADRYADKLNDPIAARAEWRRLAEGSDRTVSDDFRMREADRIRKASQAEGLSDKARQDLRTHADNLIRRPMTGDQRMMFDELKRTNASDLSHRDAGDALKLIDRYKPADWASYAGGRGIKKEHEGLFLTDGEANRLFDAGVWGPKPEIDDRRSALLMGDPKACMRCHPDRTPKSFDLDLRGFDRLGGKGGFDLLGDKKGLGDPKRGGFDDLPKDNRSGVDRAIDRYLETRDPRFKDLSNPEKLADKDFKAQLSAERERLKKENDQLQRIRANPADPTNYVRGDKDKLTDEQKKIVEDHRQAYEMRKLEAKVRPQFEKLDREYKSNGWGEDSPWYGVDNAAFLKDLASTDTSKISRYDAFRGLRGVEGYRKQNAGVFADDKSSFRASREEGNGLYYKGLDQMRAAKPDDLAAREKAIKEDPNNPIAYLKRPMSELADAEHERVTKDYSRYGIERLEQKLRGQTVAGIGKEVDRLDKHFDRMLNEQGVVGVSADWLKNHIGSEGGWVIDSNLGSNAVGRTIAEAYQARQSVMDLANFKGTNAEFQKAYQERIGDLQSKLQAVQGHMQRFQKSQNNWVDGIADVTSTVAAIGGAALAPVTGGASLFVGAAIGASVKVGVKGVDALTGSGHYQGNMLVDGLTGGLNGLSGVGSGMAARKGSELLLKQATLKLAEGESISMLTRAGVFMATRSGVGAADGFTVGTANALIRGDEDPLGHGLRGAAFGAVLFPLTDGASAGLGKLWKAARGTKAPAGVDGALDTAGPQPRGTGGGSELKTGGPGPRTGEPDLKAPDPVNLKPALKTPEPPKPISLDADRLKAYVSEKLGVPAENLTVQVPGEGRSGDLVYLVRTNAGDPVGVFKVFKNAGDAANEASLLKTLNDKGLKQYQAVRGYGEVPVTVDGQLRQGMLMEMADGASLSTQAARLPAGGAERTAAVQELGKNIEKVAGAMAEFHGAFTTGKPPASMTQAEKAGWLEHALTMIDRANTPANAAMAKDLARAKAAMQKAGAEMIASEVPATAYHGDANAGNFIIDPKGNVRVIDVGSMKWSLDSLGRGKATGAADVGRLAQSLDTLTIKGGGAALQPAEVKALQDRFLNAYAKASGISPDKMAAAVKLSRAELEVAAIRYARSPQEAAAAMERLKTVLGVE